MMRNRVTQSACSGVKHSPGILVRFLSFLLLLMVCTVAAEEYVIWSGGVGEDERAMAPTGNTKLVFFEVNGPYLSDVKVIITNKKGAELVNTTSNGPWLILDLPNGEYKVIAQRGEGEKQGISFKASGPEKEYALMFSATD